MASIINFPIKFTKMHGLGNDFVFINKHDLSDADNIQEIVEACAKRHTGIGCDQIIIYEEKKDNISLEIYNSDGSRAEACGNATRSIAYIFSQRTGKKDIVISVGTRILNCNINDKNHVSVNMGKVNFASSWMPDYSVLSKELKTYLSNSSEFLCVDIGNPHLVIIDPNIHQEDIEFLGPKFEKSSLFPKGANINFASINNDIINLKVWERGTGFTYACGSGACASFAASSKLGFVGDKAVVKFELGDLTMEYKNDEILMSGPVTLVAEGIYFYTK